MTVMPELVDWLVRHVPEFNELVTATILHDVANSCTRKRLPSLYSDLAQQKSANPDGFAANVTSWEQALTRAALAGQLPAGQKIILDVSSNLISALRTSKYGQPTRLGLVFDEAIKHGSMMRSTAFKSAEDSIYKKRWIPSLGTVGSWLLHQTGLWSTASFDSNGKLVKGQLILTEVLESLADKIRVQQEKESHSMTDRVMSREAFQKLLTKVGIDSLTSPELDCLLLYLQRDVQMLTYNSTTVKFKESSTTRPEPVTEEDVSIASIKSLMDTLSVQIASLTAKVNLLQENAQMHVRNKNRNSALTALKSKRLAEKNLEQRTVTFQQLEEVFSKIEQAVDQVQIMQVMQSSASTLKTLNQRVGGVDRVDTIMEDLREQISQTDEVDQVMSEPLDSNAIVDDGEIDDEFEAMEREEAAKKEQLEADAIKQRFGEVPNPASVETDLEPVRSDLDNELAASAERIKNISLEDGFVQETGSEKKRKQPVTA